MFNMLYDAVQTESSVTLVGIWSWDRSCWFEKVPLFMAVALYWNKMFLPNITGGFLEKMAMHLPVGKHLRWPVLNVFLFSGGQATR